MMRRSQTVLDELLVLECQGGNRRAFELLVERWQPRLERMIRGLTLGEDGGEVVQEVWLAIVRGLGRLQDPSLFPAWAYRIARFKSADWIRMRQRGRRLDERAATEPSAAAPASADALEVEERGRKRGVERLRAALADLSPSDRSILEMHYLEQLSVAAVATVLDIPAGTVKSRLFHARKRLRATLEESA